MKKVTSKKEKNVAVDTPKEPEEKEPKKML
jgi:hypothetical protein